MPLRRCRSCDGRKNYIQKESFFTAGKETADSGYYKWGKTITPTYLPQNNDEFFVGCDLSLVDWLSRFSYDHYEEFVRGWLGRMLFSGEEALKKASVISGGEKVRCRLV